MSEFSRQSIRREHLVTQAALQRTVLAQGIEPWRAPLALADQGLAALRIIRAHPAWVIGGLILLAGLRRGRGGKWLQRGWLTSQFVRALRAA